MRAWQLHANGELLLDDVEAGPLPEGWAEVRVHRFQVSVSEAHALTETIESVIHSLIRGIAPQADVTYATRLDDTGDALVVRTTDVVRGVVDDLLRETPTAVIAARFHATLADVIVSVCGRIRERTDVGAVALSGGVFQNARLLEAALVRLETAGFEVYSHRDVPANDGGLALGQAAVAARQLSEKDNG